MSNENNKYLKYNDILNRIKNNFSFIEAFILTIKENFTNNIFFYFLCVFFRFIPIISFSCDYSSIFGQSFNSKIVLKSLRVFTLHNLFEYFHFSYKIYIIITLIIYCSFVIRLIIYGNVIIKIYNHKLTNKWPLPSKYRIISDHVLFLLFPYILEYISFSYFMFFFPDKFYIKLNKEDKTFLIVIMIINAILIIFYNKINNLYIFCSNRIFTTTIFEAYSRKNKNKNFYNNNTISFRCTNFIFYIFMFLQNLILILPIEKFINENKYKIIFKAILNIILLLIVLIIFFSRIYEYKYRNFINTLINILLLFSFYSIIFDFIIFINQYKINNKLFEIIYLLIKIFFSYITFSLYTLKTQKFLESNIIDILFQEKISAKKESFINSFYYFNEIMIKIKEEKDIISIYLLIGFLNKHINNCYKSECNCKILEYIINETNFNKKEIEKLKNYTNKILNILSYFFESSFIEFEFYDKYELSILLSEHFCHLKNNSTMAFSIINTLIQKQKNSLSKYEMVILYELSQKYIYYISAEIKKEFDLEIYNNKKELLINCERKKYFSSFFNNLKTSNKVKKIAFNYIDNLIIILKYKNIFEESISFQFDENNENIISCKLEFLNKISNIETNKNKMNENKTNLYNVINLLRKEKLYHRDLKYTINQSFFIIYCSIYGT